MSPDPTDPTTRPPGPREIEEARRAVLTPAILLVATGLLSFVATGIALYQLPDVPAKMDEAIAKVEADPNVDQEKKDTFKEVFTTVKEVAEHPAAPVGYVVGLIASAVVILGGVKLMNLSGTVLPVTGSLLATIPCTVGCCCLLGLPAGIWSLAVLTRPAVRAAIAANRTAPPADPDAQYMR